MTLPAKVESNADTWGMNPDSTDRSSREFPVSTFSTVRCDRTIDYHERERILARIRREIVEIKILLGLASRWPRLKPRV